MALTISELGREAGVGVETIRYYQRRGLLADPRPQSRPGKPGSRHYGEDDVRRLRFVRKAQAAGFTLAEIGELTALDAVGDRARARAMATARLAVLDEEIAALEAARRSLRRLARDCAGGGAGACPIIEAFSQE